MGEYSGSSPMGDGRNVSGSKYSGDAKQGNIEINQQEYKKVLKKYKKIKKYMNCLLYTSPSPRDVEESRMPSSA